MFASKFNALITPISSYTPPKQDLHRSLLAWSLYLGYLVIYCVAYQIFIAQSSPDPFDSALWALREWAPWLPMTPLLCGMMRRSPRDWRRQTIWTTAALVVALTYRVGLDVYLTGQTPVTSLVYFFPNYLLASLLIPLIWHLAYLLESYCAYKTEQPANKASIEVLPPGYLLVSKGQRELPLAINEIEDIESAGNYVEIRRGGETFLLRRSLASLESELSTARFVRIHRRHLVNIDQIRSIEYLESGRGQVLLHNGKCLSLSKTYRRRLAQLRHVSRGTGSCG